MFSDRVDCINQVGSNKSKALIVEDNQLVQLVHKSMLIELGYEVDVVSSGEEALSKIENDYDCILLDIELPGINGVKVAIKFSQHLGHDRQRIIAITSYSQKFFREECCFFGIEQVLNKPISFKKLKRILQVRHRDLLDAARICESGTAFSKRLKVSRCRVSNWYNRSEIEIPYKYAVLIEHLSRSANSLLK